MHTRESMNFISNSLNNNIFVKNSDDDVLKHIESLRTRLGFARFKLSNGWENNTLGDVECFWKQKQKQSMRNIPIPRFTQQDIIDKRSYIQASGAKHAKARRYRLLNRSLSSPSSKKDQSNYVSSYSSDNNNKSPMNKKTRRKSHPISQPQYISNEEEDMDDDNSSNSSYSTSQEQQQQQDQSSQNYYFHHYDNNNQPNKKKSLSSSPSPTPLHSVSSFDASCVPTDLNGEPSVVKNSLDYLSYAIAMTEKNHPRVIPNYDDEDVDELEEEDEEDEIDDTNRDWTRTSQLRLSLSIPNCNRSQTIADSPSSPSTNIAAQAMLMFVNREASL